MRRGPRLPSLPSPWAPAAVALARGHLLLLALSLGLAGAQKTLAEVPVQPGFDAQKVEGRWLTIRVASSQADLVSPTDPLRLALHSIETQDRDLELILFWTGEGVCKGVNVTLHPTGLQGQYLGSFEGAGSMLVRFVGTDQSSIILYVGFQDGGDSGREATGGGVTSLWALLARRVPGDPEWLGKYLEYVSEFRLREAPVFNLDAQCPPPEA